jgi:hypothetical protein
MQPKNEGLTHENLLNNTLLEFGTNSTVLTHPDVVGIKVGKDTAGNRIWVEVFVVRITDSLSELLQKEFEEFELRLTPTTVRSRVESLSF